VVLIRKKIQWLFLPRVHQHPQRYHSKKTQNSGVSQLAPIQGLWVEI
jgi:hypothetical protein